MEKLIQVKNVMQEYHSLMDVMFPMHMEQHAAHLIASLQSDSNVIRQLDNVNDQHFVKLQTELLHASFRDKRARELV